MATIQDGCKITTLTMSAKDVFQTYRYGGSGDDPSCPGGAARIVKLIDASEFSEDGFTNKQKEAESYYSKEYRDYLKAVRAQIASAKLGEQSHASQPQRP